MKTERKSELVNKLGKWVFISLIFALVVIACLPIAYGILYTYLDSSQRGNWRDNTSPLDSRVVDDICSQFDISSSDWRCGPNAIVYAPDFFRTIGQYLKESDTGMLTFDDVEGKLGKYKYHCEPTITESDGKRYFVCRYDLNGDRIYPIVIFFYDDGRIMRVIADVGD